MGQIQKLIFQRLRKSDGTKNEFEIATADPAVKATWTPLIIAADGTKIVTTPFIEAPENEPGEARTFGGGNQTLGGIEINVGREPSTFTAMLYRAKQAIIKQMKALECEDGNLGVFFVDEFGKIAMLNDGQETPTHYKPIPVRAFFVGDKKFGGLEEPDSNMLQFQLLPNWSDNLQIVSPSDFDALEELHPA